MVELLVVVVILAVLATIAIPMLSSSSQDSKQSALDQNLTVMNEAIERYYVEHGGTYPGTLNGRTSWEIFVQQMTTRTDKTGAAGDRCGPYLRTGIPKNPFTGTNTGTTGRLGAVGSDIGWRYDAVNGVIRAGSDRSGNGGFEPIPKPTGG